MYVLDRLGPGHPFEVSNQLGDTVRIGPGFATVVAGPESFGVVSLVDKGAVVSTNFFIAGLKQPVKEARMDTYPLGSPRPEGKNKERRQLYALHRQVVGSIPTISW